MKKLLVIGCLLLLTASSVMAQPGRTPQPPSGGGRPGVENPPATHDRSAELPVVSTPEGQPRNGEIPSVTRELPTLPSDFSGLDMETVDLQEMLALLDEADYPVDFSQLIEILAALSDEDFDPEFTASLLVLLEDYALEPEQIAELQVFLSEITFSLTDEQITAIQSFLTELDAEDVQAFIIWLQTTDFTLSDEQIANLQTLLDGGSVSLSDTQIDMIMDYLDEYTDLTRAELIVIEKYLNTLEISLTAEQITAIEALLEALEIEL